MVTVECDLFADLHAILVAAIQAEGFKVSDVGDLARVAEQYYTMRERLVEPRRRRVKWSQELRAARMPTAIAEGVQRLRKRFEQGKDVRPFLSKNEDASFNDMLLADWGLHHFHLGKRRPGQRHADRTGPVLLAHVRPFAVYLVNLYVHQFNRQEALKILADNWPELMSQAPLLPVPGGGVTDADVAKMRKAGIVTLPQVDGKVLMGPGGGYMGNGLSWNAATSADRIMNATYQYEQQIRGDAKMLDRIATMIEQKKGLRPSAIRLKLHHVGKELQVVEQHLGDMLAALPL